MHNYKYAVLIATIVITGCSSSSDGGETTIVTSNNPNTNQSDLLSNINTSRVVSRDDIYDPNSLVTNVCAAPYYENLSGVYEGTISINDDGSLISAVCTWDVVMTLTRVYTGTSVGVRNVCGFDAEILATAGPTPADTTTIMDNGTANGFEIDVEYLTCTTLDTSFEIVEIVDEPELSNPTYPEGIDMFFEFPLETQNGSNQTVLIYPTGDSAFQIQTNMDTIFDGAGNMTLSAATRVDPIWFTNISKVRGDLDP